MGSVAVSYVQSVLDYVEQAGGDVPALLSPVSYTHLTLPTKA